MSKVIIYSTPTCAFCRMAKNYFRENNIQYTDIDVSKNVEKQREAVEKSGQMGVPVIDISGEIIIGFDKPKIEKALKEKGILK